MDRLTLAEGSPEISRMVYGTWRIPDEPGVTAQAVNRRLNLCVDLGITTIDTAEIYGDYGVEALLGAALALSPGLRDRVEIVTKSGIYIPTASAPGREIGHYDASGARLRASVERALRLLRTDRIDLFLIHRPDWLTAFADSAAGLNAAMAAGDIRAAGVSNFSASQFAALNGLMDRPLATNQVEFSLMQMAPMFDGTFDQAQALGVVPMAWSPLAGARMFQVGDPAAIRLSEAAEILAPKYGATLEQLAYAWVMAHPARPVPIIGSNRPDRIESAAKAAGIVLKREDWFRLWVAAKGHNIP